MVEDTVYRLLHDENEWVQSEAIKSVKGPLIEFMMAPRPEQVASLMSKLKDATDAALKIGVGRFEVLLRVVGLGGPVDKSVAKAVLEFTEARHLLVHRLGKADKQFVDRCPWIKLGIGDPFAVQLGHYDIYSTAVLWYARELNRRLREKRGRPEDSEGIASLKEAVERINKLWTMRHDLKSVEGPPKPKT